MYNTSEYYNIAAAKPIQEHRITGTIGTSGLTFDNSNIIEGSFQITNQCTDTNALVFGSCYVGELTCEFTGLEYSASNQNGIHFSDWIGLSIVPTFGIYCEDNHQWDSVPLGVYTIKEAVHTENGVQITAYDDMSKFDVEIPADKLSYLLSLKTDNLYAFAAYVCWQCDVVFGMTRQEFDALPNATSTVSNIEIYGDNSDNAEFANDINTYRDVLYWIAQTMCCFATMNRDGYLVFRKYPSTSTPVATIGPDDRLEGMTLADYVTHVTGIYVTNLDDNKEMYYGYDADTLADEIEEVETAIGVNAQAQLDLEIEYQQGQITEEEYKAQKKVLVAEEKQLDKRLAWLEKAYQSADHGKSSSIELGPNPFLMYGGKRSTQNTHRKKVLKNALALSYTPFTMSVLCGWHYDLGDLIQIAGGRFNSATDSFCCVMGYTFNLHGECTLEGYGENPALAKVKTKASRQANTANSNAVNAKEISSGTDTPDNDEGKSNDIYIKYATKVTKTPKVTIEEDGYVKNPQDPTQTPPADYVKITELEWDNQAGGYNIKISGNFYESTFNFSPIIKANISQVGSYKILCDAKCSDSNVEIYWFNQPYSFYGMTHSDTAGVDQPVACMWLCESVPPDGQWQSRESNSFGVSQRDLDEGNIRFWISTVFVDPNAGGAHVDIEIKNLRIVYIDPNTGQPEPDGGVNTNTEKYIDKVYVKTEDESGNKVWKEIEYVAGADTSQNSGLSLNYKRWLSLTPEVMRALVKADPPQADVDFYRYCIRYTGDPDKTLSLAYNTATSWTNGSVKKTKEHVYTIKSSGAYNSGAIQQIAYKIEGLTSGVKYWFNFWARFTGAEFGEDFRKGLGLVWSTTNSINTDDWEGDPHTYNDTSKYLSFYRVNGKRYYEAGVTATASTMYMILTVGDLTDGSNIVFTLGDMVISQNQKKYARSMYLYDVPSETWIRYKPFGMSDDDGESDISYLNELNDVTIDNPTDGQVLMWDATNQEWVNGTGGGSSDLDAIELTQAQYDQLTPQQKADPDKIYFIRDGGGSGGGGGGGDSTVRYDENTRFIQVYDHGTWINAYRLPFFTKLMFETSQTINTTYTFTEDGDFIVWSSCCVNEPTSTSKVSTTATVVSSNTKSGLDSDYTRTCEYYVLRAQAGDTVTFAMTSYSYNSVGVFKITGLSLTEEEFAFTVDGHATLSQTYDSSKKYLTLLITSGGNRSISGNGNAIESWAEQYNSVDYIEYNGNTVNYDAYGYAGGAGAVIVFEVT